MIAVRAGVVIGAMALVVLVVFAFENRQTRGDTLSCVVEEVLPGKKIATVFARCDSSLVAGANSGGVGGEPSPPDQLGLVKVPVPPAAAIFHGTPGVGERLVVRQNDRGAVWDKPAARHALSGMLVPGFLVISAFLWWRRTA